MTSTGTSWTEHPQVIVNVTQQSLSLPDNMSCTSLNFLRTEIMFFVLFCFLIFIYFAGSSLRCGTRDLPCSMRDLLVAACGLLVAACVWDLVPWPGIKPGPLHWERRVLTTGPPGKSQRSCVFELWLCGAW